MERTVEATFDGEVFRPDEPVDLVPNTRVTIVIEETENGDESDSFLKVARSLQLRGPADFSENIDDYLYGGKPLGERE